MVGKEIVLPEEGGKGFWKEMELELVNLGISGILEKGKAVFEQWSLK